MREIKTSELKGEKLNYAVGVALEENIKASMGNPDSPFKSPKVYYTRGGWDRSYRFNPSESAALFNRLEIPTYGASNLADACRIFVEDVLGKSIRLPEIFKE